MAKDVCPNNDQDDADEDDERDGGEKSPHEGHPAAFGVAAFLPPRAQHRLCSATLFYSSWRCFQKNQHTHPRAARGITIEPRMTIAIA